MRIPLFFTCLGLFCSTIQPATADTVTGAVQVVDAVTLTVGGRKLQLYGIKAPAPQDICPFRNRSIPCGEVAATALMGLTAGARVACETRGDTGGMETATCKADGYDLAEGMVYTGWARPVAGAPARYLAAQKKAQARRNGLWQGRFPDAVERAAGR
jgi:endonuclease YncB( thermonuclease family)